MNTISLGHPTNLTLEDFQYAAHENEASASLVISNKTGSPEIKTSSGSFFGKIIRWITGAERKANNAILENFKQALLNKYGPVASLKLFINLEYERATILKEGLKPFMVLSIISNADKTSMPVALPAELRIASIALPLSQNENLAQEILLGMHPYYATAGARRMLQSDIPLTEVEASPDLTAEISEPIDKKSTDANHAIVAQKARPFYENIFYDKKDMQSQAEDPLPEARPLTSKEITLQNQKDQKTIQKNLQSQMHRMTERLAMMEELDKS